MESITRVPLSFGRQKNGEGEKKVINSWNHILGAREYINRKENEIRNSYTRHDSKT